MFNLTDQVNADEVRRALRRAQPFCFLSKSSNQTLTTGVDTAITWNVDQSDAWGMHDTGSNTERIVAPIYGRYFFTVNVTWPAAGSGTSTKRLRLLSNALIQTDPFSSGAAIFAEFDMVGVPDSGLERQHLCGVGVINAGDYVYAEALQATGGDLDIEAGNFSTSMVAIFLG